MAIFDEFAHIYSRGDYGDFSRHMADLLPAALRQVGFKPKTVLDLACGDGTFAVVAAQSGFEVTGLDMSPRMLQFARERAREAGVDVKFVPGDMRALTFKDEFDLTTCWYDSLNYLTEPGDLRAAFAGVSKALKPGGLFVFDMNTVYGLAVKWPESPCYVQQDGDRIFEVHLPAYDFETGLASMRIVAFSKQGDAWRRIEEVHEERAYPQREIRAGLTQAGFHVLACWGSFREMSEPAPDTGRVWYIAKKAGESV